MKTVTEVSRMAGISVRTLHHYHSIGLLEPSRITPAGYRLYDRQALTRLGQILLFRELEFSLEEIRQILDDPDFDPQEALIRQIHLLELRRDHLNALIAHARQIHKTGGITPMDLTLFDRSGMERYQQEARTRWGHTQAYREYEEKQAGQSPSRQDAAAAGLMDLFRQFGAIRHQDPAGAEARHLVDTLQAYITAHFYTCTPEILQGLGQMYGAGGSMTDNIDAAGGPGTAAFASRAIALWTGSAPRK